MNWGPQDWIGWAGTVKAFFSQRGAIVTKIVISKDREGEFFMAAITDPDKFGKLIDPCVGKESPYEGLLHGVPLMFTSKLPADRALFEVKDDPGAA